MAALDFPSAPSVDQVYTANGRSWTWNGTSWIGTGGNSGVVVPSWVTGHPLTKPGSPHAKDEYWDDTSGNSGSVNGLAAAWTTFGAAQTRSYVNGKLVLTGTAAGGTSPNLSGLYKAEPATPYTVTVEVVQGADAAYNFNCLGFRESATGKLWLIAFGQNVPSANTFNTLFSLGRYASPTSRTSSALDWDFRTRRVWLRITDDGTTVKGYVSFSGVAGTFRQQASESYATALFTTAPDQFFVGVDPFSTSTPIGEFGPVRVS